MQQFLVIAVAHFLALLSPGPDFFLIARISLAAGWRTATGACVGIALANGVFIAAAFAGTAILRQDSLAFTAVQLAGVAYLLCMGVLFVRHAGKTPVDGIPDLRQPSPSAAAGAAWRRACGMGFLSGILNPKNALFYASLAAMLTGPQASAGWKMFYGAWMFCVVLGWDMSIAMAIGHPRVLRRFSRLLPSLEKATGMLLIALALGLLWALHRADQTAQPSLRSSAHRPLPRATMYSARNPISTGYSMPRSIQGQVGPRA